MNLYQVAILLLSLIVIENLYFKIAGRLQLVDLPNHRSSHSKSTIRGGGIIIPIGVLAYSLFQGIAYPYMTIGLVIILIISFVDDLGHLPPVVRVMGQVSAMALLFFEVAENGPISISLVLLFIVAVGILNAYNFMDGINGIMASYSVVLLLTLYYVQKFLIAFTDIDFVLTAFLGVIIFTFYNFRTSARCFAGDVGSVSMAFIAVFLIGQLIYQTGNPIWILLLAVFGTDSVLTIVHRLIKRENIFEAHRSHLYQHYANEKGTSHLKISIYYAAIQLGINILIVFNYQLGYVNNWFLTAIILVPLASIYIYLKVTFERKFQSIC